MTELELALVALGRELDVPETPDLVPAVLSRLERRRRWVRRPRWALAVALAVVAALGATLAIPSARSAFLRLIHVGGEEIAVVDELPTVQPELNLDLALGRSVTLAEARRLARFRLRELDETPDRVYYAPDTGTVWFLYGTPKRARLLVAQTPGGLERQLFFKKVVSAGTRVELLRVDGADGAFVSGRAHVVYLLDRGGFIREESARLARDVLIWAQGGVAYRLEGDLTRKQALELARSLE